MFSCCAFLCLHLVWWHLLYKHYYLGKKDSTLILLWVLKLLFCQVIFVVVVQISVASTASCGDVIWRKLWNERYGWRGLCDAEIEMNQEMGNSWVKYRILLLLSIELYFGEAEITAKYVQPMEFLPYQWLTC